MSVDASSVSELSSGAGLSVAMVEASSNGRVDVARGSECKGCEYRLDGDTSSVTLPLVEIGVVPLAVLEGTAVLGSSSSCRTSGNKRESQKAASC
jgi:hypothetical protein